MNSAVWEGGLCRIEVPEVKNLSIFHETIELIFEENIMKRVSKMGVSRSIDVVEVVSIASSFLLAFFDLEYYSSCVKVLAGGILRFFKDDGAPDYLENQSSLEGNIEENSRNSDMCMLLGHRLRGSGNRLRLSCVVGLLSHSISRIRAKMLYATSKDRFRHELNGIYYETQATDPTEMDLEVIKELAS
ncbi:hypothetical protein GIB67_004529 [Kingdonia uniflora]|uniref:ADF-H domain-containing protein n=1 Tax=Kingdonia uniflora TaxID=39325 RepID=A0A7J7MKT2_9MAGN|nr:hypothetical protein GIB67_004529 [Kingdonia uniflora]